MTALTLATTATPSNTQTYEKNFKISYVPLTIVMIYKSNKSFLKLKISVVLKRPTQAVAAEGFHGISSTISSEPSILPFRMSLAANACRPCWSLLATKMT